MGGSNNQENQNKTGGRLAPRPERSSSPKTRTQQQQQQQIKVVHAPVDPALLRSIDLMQQSYEKNIGVIEKLYKEKMEMSSRIDELEGRLGKETTLGSHSHPRSYTSLCPSEIILLHA